MTIEKVSFEELARRYCERQISDPETLKKILQTQKKRYDPVGYLLLENQLMDSSRFGCLYVLPYGPRNTHKEIPEHPFSADGSASGTVVVVAVLEAKDLPE